MSALDKGIYQLPLLIIVDALDECDSDDHLKLVMQLFSQTRTIPNIRVKLLLTSRPELRVRLGFKKIPQDVFDDFILHEVSPTLIERDIEAYLKHELAEIQNDNCDSLSLGWPGTKRLHLLVTIATPLFISAATMCRLIRDENWNPDEQLDIVLKHRHANHTDHLSTTYMPVLERLVINQSVAQQKALLEEFRTLVGSIVILQDSLSLNSLASLLQMSTGIIKRRLDGFRSVLNIPDSPDEPIKLFHLSFRDFLVGKDRKNNPFMIIESQIHAELAGRCLDILIKTEKLKQDICSLNDPGIRREDIDLGLIQQCIPPDVRYAVLHWIHHFVNGATFSLDLERLQIFLQTKLLYWFEAVSLLGYPYAISVALADLLRLASTTPSLNVELPLISDANRLVLSTQGLLDSHPLQLYSSALMFAPKANMVRELYKSCKPTWIDTLPRFEKAWTNEHPATEGHTGGITCIDLSCNGVLASGSNDRMVNLWDINTKTLLHSLAEHTNTVSRVCFSPEGTFLASCATGDGIKLWEVMTGSLIAILSIREIGGPFDRRFSLSFGRTRQYLAVQQRRHVILFDTIVCTRDFEFEVKDMAFVGFEIFSS